MRRAVALTLCSGMLAATAACAGSPPGDSAAPKRPSAGAATAPSAGSSSPSARAATSCPDGVQAHGAPSPAAGKGSPDDTAQAQALTQAVGDEEFNAAYADIFGTVIDGYTRGRVALCVTDVARGRLLAKAAKRAHPAVDLSRLDILPCRYSEGTLQTAVRGLMAHNGTTIAGFPVYQIGPATDSSGIQLVTSQAGSTSAALRRYLTSRLGGIAFTVGKGERPVG
ncbi:hypothetical protein [Streptomyces sp. NPDC006739]|uniref:hypothetical protein n=1 Tax=Streptomyces sp. NPDC006739 TaxID=3364763 RepID=UPI00368E6CA3